MFNNSYNKMKLFLLVAILSCIYYAEGSSIKKVKSVKCGKNAHYSECPSQCPKSCANMYTYKVCNAACAKPGCVCNEGFVWDAGFKNCIPLSECCDEDIMCDLGFIFQSCGCHNVCGGPINTCMDVEEKDSGSVDGSDSGGSDSSSSDSSSSDSDSDSDESSDKNIKTGLTYLKKKYYKEVEIKFKCTKGCFCPKYTFFKDGACVTAKECTETC